MIKKVGVIGGGASGMMAAIAAAAEGAKVFILEHNEELGKKILATGNGKCNYTNNVQTADCYRSADSSFPWNVIQKYPVEKVLDFFEELGIVPKDKNGYIYPNSEQASSVQEVLRMEIERQKIKVYCNEHVMQVQKDGEEFQIITRGQDQKLRKITCDHVILATGSKASKGLGSDGSGYKIAERAGHTILPVLPALVQLRCKEKWFKKLAGVRAQGEVSLWSQGERIVSERGEIQLTDYGVSGIPVFQISRFASVLLHEKKEVFVRMDFMPDFTKEDFFESLKERIQKRPDKAAEQFLIGMIHKKIANVVMKLAGIKPDTKIGSLTDKEILRLVYNIKELRGIVTETNGFEQAQICCGGISTTEIDPDTMESKIQTGLFICGEVLDVDGICGGYNLQWAWTSGMLAGRGAARC